MTKNYLLYTKETIDNCCIGLNKPGPAHPRNNPKKVFDLVRA